MPTTKRSPGRKILGMLIGMFALVLIFLASSMIYSLPAKTEELFGPPSGDLPLNKIYTQSLILLISKDQLMEPIRLEIEEYVFPIQPGESLDSVIGNLQKLKVINHSRAFRAYLIYSGIDTRIQPGEYQFTPGLTELDVALLLGNPLPSKTKLSVLAGWRAEEIGASLVQSGINLEPAEFLAAVRSTEKEGYLFPGTYSLDREISGEQIVDLLYAAFINQISPGMEELYEIQGLDLHQAVTLASIVEREAVLDEEMPLIASVFLNRLKNGMNLAADPTVQYAIGYNVDQGSWWTNPLSLEDLEYPSPYNTYQFPGLPPGPICNPGLSSLLAVANPPATDFLFFRAACDGSGSHNFAVTFEEHLNNACE